MGNNSIVLLLDLENESLEIKTIKNDLSTVLFHIINNARDILLERKIQKAFIKITAKDQKGEVVIEIEDNGGGVSSEIINKIFDPYFTTKHKSQGVGMGLYICHIIMSKNLQSQISVSNTVCGAKFTINLKNLT